MAIPVSTAVPDWEIFLKWMTPVNCLYPDGGPVALSAVNSPLIREGAYRRFAEIVARKFYEHTLEL